MLQGCEMVLGSRFATHRPVTAVFRVVRNPDLVPTLRVPRPVPAEDLEGYAIRAPRSGPEPEWADWCRDAETALLEAAGIPRRKWAAHLGRGCCPRVISRRVAPADPLDLGPPVRFQAGWLLVARRIDDACDMLARS